MSPPGGPVLLASAAPGIPALGPSGSSAHLRGLAWAIHRAGHPLRLVMPERDSRGAHGAVPVPVESAAVPGWPSWLGRWRERREAWFAARLAALAAQGPPPALIVERWSLFSDLGARVRARTGAPWVLEVNAPLALERARYETLRDPAWAARRQREVLQAADLVVAVSPWLVRWLEGEVGVPAARVALLPNGVEPHRGQREVTRAALGVQDRLVIGFLGSNKPWHGAERVAELVRRLPGSVGLLVGQGAPEPPPGVPVLRVGQVDEARAADLVAAMDLGLAPYGPDAPPWFCPLKVLAYRAQGTPVLASDVGELGALVGEGGALLPPGDLEAWVAAAGRWAGRRGPVWVRSWDGVWAELLQHVRGLGGADASLGRPG